jgi:hypothetical protein
MNGVPMNRPFSTDFHEELAAKICEGRRGEFAVSPLSLMKVNASGQTGGANHDLLEFAASEWTLGGILQTIADCARKWSLD